MKNPGFKHFSNLPSALTFSFLPTSSLIQSPPSPPPPPSPSPPPYPLFFIISLPQSSCLLILLSLYKILDSLN